MRSNFSEFHLHFYLMRKVIKSMSKIIKSMRKIINSMREDLKSMRKVFQLNARSFSNQCARSTSENLKSMLKVIAQSLSQIPK